MQMALAARGGVGSFPQLALGLRQAVGGFNALKTSLTGLDAELAATVLPLAAIAVGVTAIGTAAIAYGVSVFKFSQQMNQLSLAAKSLGVGFGELKNMVDYGDRFGQTSEQVVSGAAKMSKALADLGENGSKLRQQLQSQGMDPNFLARLARVDDLRVANNMLREYGLLVEKAELARGKTRIQAKQSARSAVESAGGDPDSLDRPAIPPPDPAAQAQLKFVADQSAMISRIWADIKESFSSISLDALTVGLPVVNLALVGIGAALKLIEGTFTGIKLVVDGIVTGVKIIAQTLTGDFSGALKSFKELGLRTGDRLGFGGHEEAAKPGDPPKNMDRWWNAPKRWFGGYEPKEITDEQRAKLLEDHRARQQNPTYTGRSIQLPGTPQQFQFQQPGTSVPQVAPPGGYHPTSYRGANDNVNPLLHQASFSDGFGASTTSTSGSSEDRLQGIIKGGVFDALVEFSTYLRTGEVARVVEAVARAAALSTLHSVATQGRRLAAAAVAQVRQASVARPSPTLATGRTRQAQRGFRTAIPVAMTTLHRVALVRVALIVILPAPITATLPAIHPQRPVGKRLTLRKVLRQAAAAVRIERSNARSWPKNTKTSPLPEAS